MAVEKLAQQKLGEREDLTHLPIVAIDPADARDHDDAIWAAPDDDEDNKGGWKAIVAIADVDALVKKFCDARYGRGAATELVRPEPDDLFR